MGNIKENYMKKHLMAAAILSMGLAAPAVAQDIPVGADGTFSGEYAFGALGDRCFAMRAA